MHVVIDNHAKRSTMPASIKALVVDGDSQRRVLVQELLKNMGYSTLESCANINELTVAKYALVSKQNLLLVLCTDFVTETLEEQLKTFLSECSLPVLLFAEDIDLSSMKKATAAGVTAFISLSIQGNRVAHAIDSAVANYSVVNGLQNQIDELKTRFEHRITIDKAKGLVMKNRGLDEAQAYNFLREYAMKNSKRMVDVAQMIIATAEVLDK